MKRKTLRRIRYLMSILRPIDLSKVEDSFTSDIAKMYHELQTLSPKPIIELEWWQIYWERDNRRKTYKRKPIKIRKDNVPLNGPNYGNPSSWNGSKIRFPKKKRKTAWKRFYKLFPNLKSKEE